MNTIETLTSKMSLEKIRALVADDFTRVNSLIGKQLHSQVNLVEDIDQYIVKSGGKRLRPLIALLCAKACGYTEGDEHIVLATIIEFLHTATLLHDDVVDESNLRRGKQTVNAIWGNKASILVGDFLFSRAFQMMSHFHNFDVIRVLTHAANVIAEGEVLQLMHCNNLDIDEPQYLKVIDAKTAKLFEATAELTAIITHQSTDVQKQLAQFGKHLGLAYQLIDDMLDYSATAEEMGKNPGDDLTDGKLTLPLIHVLQKGNTSQANLIRTAIQKGDITHLKEILQIIQTTGALDYCFQQAEWQANRARECLSCLPSSIYHNALETLLEIIIRRQS